MPNKPLLILVAAISLAMILLQISQPYLRYERELILAGEIWRVWSAHFVHTNWAHLIMNTLGFWMLIFISSSVWSVQRLGYSLAFLSTGISVLLLLTQPQWQWYVGFSGVLYGLFLISGIRLSLTGEPYLGGTLTLLVVGKSLWESQQDLSYSAALIEAPVALIVHYFGLILALVWLLPEGHHAYRRYQRQRSDLNR